MMVIINTDEIGNYLCTVTVTDTTFSSKTVTKQSNGYRAERTDTTPDDCVVGGTTYRHNECIGITGYRCSDSQQIEDNSCPVCREDSDCGSGLTCDTRGRCIDSEGDDEDVDDEGDGIPLEYFILLGAIGATGVMYYLAGRKKI